MNIGHGHRPTYRLRPRWSQRHPTNPLFPHHRPRRGLFGHEDATARRIAAWTAVAALLAAGAWFLIWSPIFRVNDVKINGASPLAEAAVRRILDERLAKRWLGLVPQDNVFLFNRQAAIRDITAAFYFEDIRLNRHLPRQLEISVKEWPLMAVYVDDNRFLALNVNGLVLRELFPKEFSALGDLPPEIETAMAPELGTEVMALPTVDKASPNDQPTVGNQYPLILPDSSAAGQPDQKPGSEALNRQEMAHILQAAGKLPEAVGTRIRWFTVRGDGETVEATTAEGWIVYLSTALSLDTQNQRLALVLKEKIGNRRAELEYVDLRYDERIFFRFRTAGTQPAGAPAPATQPTKP